MNRKGRKVLAKSANLLNISLRYFAETFAFFAVKEKSVFQSKKINPKTTPFASDAVVFIKNKTSNDTLIALQDILNNLL